MKYCGSVDTISAYQRLKKQSQSANHGYATPANSGDVDRRADRRDQYSHHNGYKLHIHDQDSSAQAHTESWGKSLSHSAHEPKAFGMASKKLASASTTKTSSKRRLCKEEQTPFSVMEPHSTSISMADLLQRYQSVLELSPSASPSSSSSSSSSTSP